MVLSEKALESMPLTEEIKKEEVVQIDTTEVATKIS
jgi:hypothetical protein